MGLRVGVEGSQDNEQEEPAQEKKPARVKVCKRKAKVGRGVACHAKVVMVVGISWWRRSLPPPKLPVCVCSSHTQSDHHCL